MNLDESAGRITFLIRDRDILYPPVFDHVLSNVGIKTVRSAVRAPRMNAVMERWIGGCRRELLDRTPVWNLPHLRRILRALCRAARCRRRPVVGQDRRRKPAVLGAHANSRRTASASQCNWHEFIDTDICFSDRLHLALTGETATDWLPTWEPLPHPLETRRCGSE